MEKLQFNDIADLGNFMYELATKESQDACAILTYEKTSELLKWLLQYDDVKATFIELEHEEYNGYDKEFYIVLDTDLEIHIEQAYDEKDKIILGVDETGVLLCEEEKIEEFINANEAYYSFIIEFVGKEDNCGDCCEDCSNCPYKESSIAISMALDYLSHLLNHEND